MTNNKPKISKQAEKLLKYVLINKTVTTIQCHEELSIMHPPARIMDLRQQGWPIVTNYYQQIDARGVSHRAAQYYLQVEKLTPEQQQIQINVLARL